ncbi:pyridoxamine 5'-phosphate oxidase family protein [Achromobacter xylosoxidans]|uniref:Pyridoxamine 5'-phosphate oxidase family protein n=1 Tax=Alcaligenes xylosoxydans xylosoxydans TaxID=85698 RepID=A0A9X3L4B9_ALCXX|nr:pyridoxamine 5'-phosphate oxidase family protein [Achromobacter xylosoxidans]MCZ8405344.1 pyridoxamine 5'-phosphate oxidase family protein [Achromobacter xylosoxidans]
MQETLSTLPTWHEGETRLQAQAGVLERMAQVGQRVIRDHMPDQHRDFYAQLPFIVLGSVDGQGDAWATLLEGRPGFMQSPTPTMLDIAARPATNDPASPGMHEGAPVGLLGIEMHTRRRNRMNGVLAEQPAGWRVEVDQSFGNCPRYIQQRDFDFDREPGSPPAQAPEELASLDLAASTLVKAADAFFVASYADLEGRRQVDVSHRGGKAGFVRVTEDGTLTIPDFNGNLFFSTLGNILLNGKAGLMFVDYETGDLLQLSGDAQVILDSPEIAAFEGAERLWRFRARRIVRRPGALALRGVFRPDGWSPSSLMTGDWHQAEQRRRATELARQWRPFKVERIVDESASIRSFHLAPDDGAGLLPHEPGQYLPIRVQPAGSEAPLIRTYTLSVAPSDGSYRISVKRDGLVSRHLHDHIRVGDTVQTRAPDGAFTLDTAADRPVVLLAAGVGITPMLAMIRHLVHEGRRTQKPRSAILFYAARTLKDRAFDQELAALEQASGGAVKIVRVLSDIDGAQLLADYDEHGRIDMALLSRHLPFGDYDFYLCGPPPFMQAAYDGLRGYAIADARIHAEAFGPASLVRQPDAGAAAPGAAPPALAPASTLAVPVVFTDSLKEARWTPESGSLLELAEARGLTPEFGCREGSCGTCKTRLLEGAVTYTRPPSAPTSPDEVLLCCAVPAAEQPDGPSRIHLAL